MSESYELSYGEVLKELRIYHGYKQKDISEFLNIPSQAYSNYENNKQVILPMFAYYGIHRTYDKYSKFPNKI